MNTQPNVFTDVFSEAKLGPVTLRNRIVVVENSPYRIIAAIAEPDLLIFEEIEKGLPSGKSIVFCIAKATEIELALNMKYDPYITGGYK